MFLFIKKKGCPASLFWCKNFLQRKAIAKKGTKVAALQDVIEYKINL